MFSTILLNATETEQSLVVQEDALDGKIQLFLDEDTYNNNKEFISVIFEPKSAYYKNHRVDVVKVVETLKENGLLNLFFDAPKELKLNFKTSGAPLFFVKIMSDTLRNIGYYRYVTVASNQEATGFTWNINLVSEYATDPIVLEKELQKRGCKIIDLERNSKYEWTYTIDMEHGNLNLKTLQNGDKIHLKRSLYAHWVNVSKIRKLRVISSQRNRWYPYVSYYDASLHLLKVYEENRVRYSIEFNIPQAAKYMKISDQYTLKNVRDELILKPTAGR